MHQGDADIVVEQRIDEIGRQLAHGAVEEFDDIVSSVKAVEFLVGHHHAVAQAGLLAEDDGLAIHADRIVDFFVLDEAFAQAGVGALVTGGVEARVFGVVLLGEAVLHGSAGVSLALLLLFGKVIL